MNNINLCVRPSKGASYCFYPICWQVCFRPAQPWELPWNIYEKLKGGARGRFGTCYDTEEEALEDYWQACISI